MESMTPDERLWTAIRLESRDAKRRPVGWYLHAEPDADGRYEFPGLPPGVYRVDAHASPHYESAGREVDIRATGEAHGVDLLLERRGSEK